MTQAERYHVKHAKGLCALCSAKVDGDFWKCRRHRLREAAAAALRRMARKAR